MRKRTRTTRARNDSANKRLHGTAVPAVGEP